MEKKRYYSLELSQDKKSVLGCDPSARRVKIPYGVENIEEGAFAYCLNLESVILSNTVQIIKNRAFMFSKIKKILITENVTQIDQDAFLNSTFLNEINVDQNNPIYSSQDGVLYDKKKEILIIFPHFKIGDPFIIPDSVKIVKSGSLPKYPSIFSLVINKNLEQIDEVGLMYCLNINMISVHQDNQHFYLNNGSLYDENGIQLFDSKNHKVSRKIIENNSFDVNNGLNENLGYRSFATICTKEYFDYFTNTIIFSRSDKYFRTFLNDVDRIGEVLLGKKNPHQMLGTIMSRLYGDEMINADRLESLDELGHISNLSIIELFTLLWYVSSKNVLTYSESFYLLMSEKRVVSNLLKNINKLFNIEMSDFSV